MIYFSGLDSIIESVYLSEELDNKIGSCDIFINPSNVKYLIGKIIIINECDYPDSKLDILSKNGCHIISRVYSQREDVEVQPYILRINFGIMWNGKVLDSCSSLDSILDKDDCKFDIETNTLYFPKIKNYSIIKSSDEYSNLTALGWVLHQVGVNIKHNTVFENLDIIKTGKVMF